MQHDLMQYIDQMQHSEFRYNATFLFDADINYYARNHGKLLGVYCNIV